MSRAWFVLAVSALLGLFYVGAGMRGDGSHASGQEVKTKPLDRPAAAVSMKWESLNPAFSSSSSRRVYRAKILGGWLVETTQSTDSGTGIGLAFVPDPEHKWDGNSLP